jgi:hypothetical protein
LVGKGRGIDHGQRASAGRRIIGLSY